MEVRVREGSVACGDIQCLLSGQGVCNVHGCGLLLEGAWGVVPTKGTLEDVCGMVLVGI